MPPLPWTTAPGADANQDRQQVLRSDGAVGVALNTALPRTFFTLSAWRDRDSLDGFVRSDPHVSTMGRYRPAMTDAKFVFWGTTGRRASALVVGG